MITIGHLARTYGMLPSEVAARATTYDLMITDVYQAWEHYQQNPNAIDNYSMDQLAEALKKGKTK
jgi:hypothetical protein